MHYFQVELSVPEDEVRVVGDMIGVMITCSVLGKIENKKKRPTGLRLECNSAQPQAAVVVQHELDRNARCSLRLSFCSLTFYCSSEFAS